MKESAKAESKEVSSRENLVEKQTLSYLVVIKYARSIDRSIEGGGLFERAKKKKKNIANLF